MKTPAPLPLKALWQLKAKNRPIILSHGINSKCNLHCKFCPYWKEDKGEMSKEEVFALLEEAKSLGIMLYNAWTTEPLLRKDLPEILKHAHHLGMMTSLVTNGVLLKKRVGELSNLDFLSVSVDGIKVHEELRGVKLDKVLDGIKEARDGGITAVINCVISGKNLDEIEELIHLAQELGVWISFEPLHEYEDIPQEVWEDVGIRDMRKYEKTIDKIIELKEEGFPVINSKTYFRMIKNLRPDFKCRASDLILDVTSDGRIENCRVHREGLGRIGDGLNNVWNSSREMREKISTECRGCLFFGYAELALLYSLKPEVILNAIRILNGIR
ncbi:MAG: radical SAM protein [Methanocellales archaeon]|nr:radical SAM protein [Methanocellales archaeon]